MKKELNFGEITLFAIENGFRNFLPILGCIVLWVLTIWIPYVNVGTTIAMTTLPVALSKGKVISPLDIFDESYRKYMGEFFLVNGLKNLIIFPALMFMIVPGIVMFISYFFSTMIVVDKRKSASEAMKLSLEATDGHKWTIFFWFLFSLVISFIPVIGSVIGLAGVGYIYGQLSGEKRSSESSERGTTRQEKKVAKNFIWVLLISSVVLIISVLVYFLGVPLIKYYQIINSL